MERYLVDMSGDNGIYIRNDSYFVHLTIRDSITPHTESSPSDVEITIRDPCGVVILPTVSMVTLGSGVYTYDYTISSAATYGQYIVEVSTSTYTMRKNFDFVVMPWDCVRDIRRHSGVEEYKSISDEDIAGIAWDAYQLVLSEIYEFHEWERFRCDSSVGCLFNGTNTTVRISNCDELADRYGDGVVAGFGQLSCGTDVDAYWIDSTYARHQAHITVVDVITGRCTITQSDGVTAIPANNNGVRVNYWTQSSRWNERLMRKAVVLWSAHECVQRFYELDRATLIDLQSNKAEFISKRNRLLNLYEKMRDKIRNPVFGGVK